MARGNNSFTPFVPANQNIPEVTFRAILLGSVLGVVLAAANVYLGLYAGMTVSASIPAAVLSMGILRGIFRRGTILENNIVQTIAASGESLAAGIIFTIPAMLIAGVWTDIQFWPTTLICIAGGLLGICFMIPLRKTLIVDDKTLTYPEGVACAEVLKAGEAGGSGAKTVLGSLVLGLVFKLLIGGFSIFKGTVEWAFSLGGRPVYFGSDVSAALVGVGYICGFNVSVLVFIGGLISWGIAIPWIGLPAGSESLLDGFWGMWSTQIRYLGVGAMVVGGVWSILSMRKGIALGFKEAVLGYKVGEEKTKARTEQNMARKHITGLLIFTTILTFGLYYSLIGSLGVTLVATICMIAMSFFFVAVASYIVGMVGSSNSPVSGMTICAILLTAGLLVLFGMTGEAGIIATLGVAGVVCCAACSAGDISQDLKTGYLIGATPKSQQWMEVVGAAIPAVVMAPVLIALNHAYGIGTGQPGALKAPQANLFASLVKGIFGQGNIPWNMVIAGMGVGVAIIIADQILKARGAKFRMPVMAVGIGMYLPFTLAVPIFLGGILSKASGEQSESGNGVLFASGLIAGEAIMGVALGIILYFAGKGTLPKTLVESDLLSVLGLLGIAFMIYAAGRKKPAKR